MSAAETILTEALADPRSTLEAGNSYLDGLADGEHTERSITLRAMSLAARHTNQIDDSIEFATKAANAASAGDHEKLRLLALLTLSGSLAISGRIPEALRLIEQTIEQAGDDELRARFQFQRGAVLQDLGRATDAVEAFQSVLPAFERLNDLSAVGWTLNNLGRNLTDLGRLDEARQYLMRSLDLAVELGERAEIHGIEHNLGRLAAYAGEIPDALSWLQMSDEHYMEVSGSSVPQHVARCEVLRSAGLYAEAQDLATRIARNNLESGDIEHASNALVVAAEAALSRDDVDQALELADQALGLADAGVGSDRRTAAATRISHEARLTRDGPSRGLLGQVTTMAAEMEASGQMVMAGHAYLMAGRIALGLGELDVARSSLELVAELRAGPIETRLQAHLATALLRRESGDSRGAARAARSGLNLLDRYQSALGASDLRLGIERQGAELASIGLGLALRSHRPRRVLEWLDRTRARALRYVPVIPTGDDHVTRALAELRRVEAGLRAGDGENPDLRRRHRRLQDEIAHSDRLRRETKVKEAAFSVDTLIDALGERTLLEIGEHDRRLFAVVVRKGRAHLVELDETARVVDELAHVRFGMRRAARRGLSVDLGSITRLDQLLLGDLKVEEGALVVVPTPSLIAVPWSALPTLRGRPLLVSPSAEMWWRAHREASSGESPVVVGGPDLEVAGLEVERVASLYPGARVLLPGSGVDEIKRLIGGVSIAHIACHARFQVENPMFSSLRMGDGDLNVYDIERLERPPSMVILSACDSGYTEARAGEELAGLTSALLSMGTRTVVASVGLVPDSPATSDLMVDFHKGLVTGLEPAAALAQAQAKAVDDPERFVSAASFICVGA